MYLCRRKLKYTARKNKYLYLGKYKNALVNGVAVVYDVYRY